MSDLCAHFFFNFEVKRKKYTFTVRSASGGAIYLNSIWAVFKNRLTCNCKFQMNLFYSWDLALLFWSIV